MSPFATALKVGHDGLRTHAARRKSDALRRHSCTTPCRATREISRDQSQRWVVRLENGQTCDALDVQYAFLRLAQQAPRRDADEETDWLIERWGFTLDAIRNKPEALIGGVDWISKKWLLDAFREEENLSWQDPWMQSLDLEYHNINPDKGLFFALTPAKAIGEFNDGVRSEHAMRNPPSNTRARGRGAAVAHFQNANLSYVINWDSISCENQSHFPMSDPFQDYEKSVQKFLQRA